MISVRRRLSKVYKFEKQHRHKQYETVNCILNHTFNHIKEQCPIFANIHSQSCNHYPALTHVPNRHGSTIGNTIEQHPVTIACLCPCILILFQHQPTCTIRLIATKPSALLWQQQQIHVYLPRGAQGHRRAHHPHIGAFRQL